MIEIGPGHQYVLATDGAWKVPNPIELINQWPKWTMGDVSALGALDGLLSVLRQEGAATGTRSDNVTMLLLRVPDGSA